MKIKKIFSCIAGLFVFCAFGISGVSVRAEKDKQTEKASYYLTGDIKDCKSIAVGKEGKCSHVYFDVNPNEKLDGSTDVIVYSDNRIVPKLKTEIALFWTAEKSGSITDVNFTVTGNARKRADNAIDGEFYYSVVKAGEIKNGETQLYYLTDNFRERLAYGGGESVTVEVGKFFKDIRLNAGESVGIIINSGEKNKNDEATIAGNLQFQQDDNSLKNNFEYNALCAKSFCDGKFTETMVDLNGFSYYALNTTYKSLNEVVDLRGAKEFGKLKRNDVSWNEDINRFYLDSNKRGRVYVEPKGTGERPESVVLHSDIGQDTTFVFTAKENCVAYITELYIQKRQLKGNEKSNGVLYNVLFFDYDTNKYYSVLEDWGLINSTTESEGKVVLQNVPGIELGEQDQLLIIFDNNNDTQTDTINNAYVNLLTVDEKNVAKKHNMLDELGLFCDETTKDKNGWMQCVRKPEYDTGYWKIQFCKLGKDYSDAVIAEPSDLTGKNVKILSEEEMVFDKRLNSWVSENNTDAAIEISSEKIEVIAGMNSSVALKLRVKADGKMLIHRDSYVKFNGGDLSDGVRFAIIKNEEIVYGWRHITEKSTSVFLNSFSVAKDDEIYFVFDCFGNNDEDKVELDFVVLLKADGEEKIQTYKLSDDISGMQGENGWRYVDLQLDKIDDASVFSIEKQSGGCNGSVTAPVTSVLALLFAVLFIKGEKRK